jgi:predicted alternative tryptophan synthase beta-subunit
MSVKVICDNKNINEDNLLIDAHIERYGRRWIMADDSGKALDIKLKVPDCRVKYTPEKYDKITVDIEGAALTFFRALETKIGEDVKIESILKTGSLGLKTSRDVKEMIKKDLRRGDYIDVIINFNGIWEVSKKFYVSLELIQFRKTEREREVEVVNYFDSD